MLTQHTSNSGGKASKHHRFMGIQGRTFKYRTMFINQDVVNFCSYTLTDTVTTAADSLCDYFKKSQASSSSSSSSSGTAVCSSSLDSAAKASLVKCGLKHYGISGKEWLCGVSGRKSIGRGPSYNAPRGQELEG